MEKPSKLKHWAKRTLVLIVTLYLLFEEFVWRWAVRFLKRIEWWSVFRPLRNWMSSLGRWGSLLLLAFSSVAFLPAQLFATWVMVEYSSVLGLAILVVAKLADVAFFAMTYLIVEPKVLRFELFRVARATFLRTQRHLHRWLSTQPFYVRSKAFAKAVRERFATSGKFSKNRERFEQVLELARKQRNEKPGRQEDSAPSDP